MYNNGVNVLYQYVFYFVKTMDIAFIKFFPLFGVLLFVKCGCNITIFLNFEKQFRISNDHNSNL